MDIFLKLRHKRRPTSRPRSAVLWPRVSVTEFKDLADIKVPQHSDLKLLPPTAKPWETSLPKWFDKRYSAYFGVRLEFHDFFYVFYHLHML